MGSFKLEKSKGAKNEARGAGMLAFVLGLVTGFVIHPLGFAVAGLGLLFFLASFAASE